MWESWFVLWALHTDDQRSIYTIISCGVQLMAWLILPLHIAYTLIYVFYCNKGTVNRVDSIQSCWKKSRYFPNLICGIVAWYLGRYNTWPNVAWCSWIKKALCMLHLGLSKMVHIYDQDKPSDEQSPHKTATAKSKIILIHSSTSNTSTTIIIHQ